MIWFVHLTEIIQFCSMENAMMIQKRTRILLIMIFFTVAVFAQGQGVKVKIVDLENVKTVVDDATTSSSTGMDDFPVYQNGVQKLMHLDDFYMILVRHDQKASDPNLYVVVELLDMEHKSSMYEMARYMRFSGSSEAGPFSIKVKDINTIEVLRKGY